jgi:hypothetical protein
VREYPLVGYSPRTQKSYVNAVRNLAKYYMRSPDLLTEDDIRRFFLHCQSAKTSAIKIKKVKMLFISLVRYGTKTSAKISAKTFDIFMCN